MWRPGFIEYWGLGSAFPSATMYEDLAWIAAIA